MSFKDSRSEWVVRQTYHPSTPNVPPVVRETYPQQTVLQETEEQNIVVVEQLENFGISSKSAKSFAKNYPEDYIVDKLALVQWLVDQGSPLVRKNPAGWLKTAIEDDFKPPKDYQSPSIRKAKSERQAKAALVETEKRKKAEEDYRLAQEETQRRVRENHPPEPVGTDGLTTESASGKVRN